MIPHQLGGLVPSTEGYTFDLSFGIGWLEVMSWYSMEKVRQLDTSMATCQQRPWITRGTQGPHCFWDPGGIFQHIIELVGDGSSYVMDLMLEHTHIFRSPSKPQLALVTGWFDRGANKFHELSWHIDSAWSHRVTSLLGQELVGGDGINRLSNRKWYGESALLLTYGM